MRTFLCYRSDKRMRIPLRTFMRKGWGYNDMSSTNDREGGEANVEAEEQGEAEAAFEEGESSKG